MPPLGPQGTYKWSDAVATATQMVHSIPTAPLQLFAADQINSIIWKTFPWRWTLNALTPITLVNGQQDYTPVPTDFWRWINPRLVRTDITPNINQPLKTAKHLEVEVQRQGGILTIQTVSYEPTVNSFRLDVTPQISGTITAQLAGDYQQLPIKLDSVNDLIPFPDSYFGVALEGILWMLYRLADDPRAGGVSINRPGERQEQGQLGVFQNALEDMKRNEDIADDMSTRFPEGAMGQRSTNSATWIWPV